MLFTDPIAVLKLSKTVTESLTEEELNFIRNEVAATYGVEAHCVVLDEVYQTKGSISLSIDGDIDDPVPGGVAKILQSEIASLAGIFDDNFEVNILV